MDTKDRGILLRDAQKSKLSLVREVRALRATLAAIGDACGGVPAQEVAGRLAALREAWEAAWEHDGKRSEWTGNMATFDARQEGLDLVQEIATDLLFAAPTGKGDGDVP